MASRFGVCAVLVGMLVLAGAAAAAKVVNPGAVKLRTASGALLMSGTATDTGALTFPADSVGWPLVLAEGDDPGGTPSVTHWELRATGTDPVGGTVAPAARKASLALSTIRYEIFATGAYLGATFTITCALGSAEDPADLTLDTASTGGKPYDQSSGKFVATSDVTLPSVDAPADCTVEFPLPVDPAFLVQYVRGLVADVSAVSLSARLAPAAKSPVQRGTARADVLRGTAFAETLYGLGGKDSLFGLASADRLFGGKGADRLAGGDGADLLSGGDGPDVIAGGAGSDTIYARDGFADTILCGAGRDRVRADRKDHLVGCEVRL